MWWDTGVFKALRLEKGKWAKERDETAEKTQGLLPRTEKRLFPRKFSVVEYVIIHVNLDASIAGFMFVDCEDDKVVSSP